MKNNWRHNLDWRDPDYLDPPTEEEIEAQREWEEDMAEMKQFDKENGFD